jgi:hypothetical protein
MATGAGSFSDIPGATLASYTTGVLAPIDNGTQFRCKVTNTQNSVTSSAALLGVLAAGTNFITSKTLGTLRNDFNGWVGMSITTPPWVVTINSLGRIVAPGNSGVHTLKIVDANGNDVAGASTQISMAGGTAGAFVYSALTAPVVLKTNATYYVLSQETSSGDQWYNNDTTAQTTTDGLLAASVYGNNGTYVPLFQTAGRLFGPVDFQYTAAAH